MTTGQVVDTETAQEFMAQALEKAERAELGDIVEEHEAKSARFRGLLAPATLRGLERGQLRSLLRSVFATRRKADAILDDLGSPDRLDNHRWARSLTVDQLVAEDQTLQRMGRGYQLLAVLSKLFREMMPSVPPRRGKRLDTQWGQFGLLAALYFAPFEYATVRPTSLLDAWGRIDQAIPLFVYGKPDHDVPESQLGRYRLLAGEEAAPNSTLSDWHTKGLERLAELFLSREQHLSGQVAGPRPCLFRPWQASRRPACKRLGQGWRVRYEDASADSGRRWSCSSWHGLAGKDGAPMP